jgi:hypothetical protein
MKSVEENGCADRDNDHADAPSQPVAETNQDSSAPEKPKVADPAQGYVKTYWDRFVGNPTQKIIDWLDHHDGLMTAVATLAIAYFTWSLAHDSSGQLRAIQGQLDEMKSQRAFTVAQLRANLRREHPDLHPIGVNGQPIGVGETLGGWEVNPWWTNVGGTDAINVVSWWKLSSTFRNFDCLAVGS